ncbi:hypothetical protein C0Q44_09370 [Paenibacillus sp. PCH8]|uniref:WGxxGxxG family protein n=1 Tax=Paenibacillus sp. PCH8 TaxID=2066524 RepID=UPI000CF98CF6|nr:WGxxGxxG family protein [Paenibacillus sp. PCH8]PQP84720.1 hypothetical protein C0Q44_09370 [Paenibacillus sp. PCH8]
MMKKGTTIVASMLLVAALAGPAGAQGHTAKGMDTNGSRVHSYQDSNYMNQTNMNGDLRTNGDYRTNSVRANANTTTNRDNGMDWGWLGLLGLLGLAGMRKRVTDHNNHR